MPFFNKLNITFLSLTVLCLGLLLNSSYKNYKFDNNPLSNEINKKIAMKKSEIRKLIKKRYKVEFNPSVIVTDKMSGKLFGMAAIDANEIKIYLNKKRFKESLNYMIEDVLPHEYAHALMFRFGNFSSKNSGHTITWQKICKNLNGSRCDRFVNHNDILIDKTKLF